MSDTSERTFSPKDTNTEAMILELMRRGYNRPSLRENKPKAAEIVQLGDG